MRLVAGLAVFALTVLFSLSALATAFSVAPVTVHVPPPGRTAIITVKNHGETAAAIQIRPFSWQQRDGEDVLSPTPDVVASPPIANVLPGAVQTVRIVRIGTDDAADEAPYRLIVDEIPDTQNQQSGTVKVFLRYSIPVFFAAQNADRSDVTWQLNDTSPISLTLHNRGHGHLRIADLRLITPEGSEVSLRKGLVGYVLGGSSITWTFNKTLSPGTMQGIRVAGKSQHGSFDAAIDGRASR
ncbi:MAG: fimbrial biogenesis chaperone [Methyloligella sp. ZOD6]